MVDSANGSGGTPTLIGWKEFIDLPEWEVFRVKAKIDTGARTSALGALACDLREEGGRTVAVLRLAPYRRHPDRVFVIETPVLRTVKVRSTSGGCEARPLVEVLLRLGPVTKRVEMTVTNRAHMLHAIILGRKALAGDFAVDAGRKYALRSEGR